MKRFKRSNKKIYIYNTFWKKSQDIIHGIKIGKSIDTEIKVCQKKLWLSLRKLYIHPKCIQTRKFAYFKYKFSIYFQYIRIFEIKYWLYPTKRIKILWVSKLKFKNLHLYVILVPISKLYILFDLQTYNLTHNQIFLKKLGVRYMKNYKNWVTPFFIKNPFDKLI